MRPINLYEHTRQRSALYATDNLEDSMTQQDDAKNTDINVIVGRFMKTGQLPTINAQAITGDFVGADDFRDHMEKLNKAKASFLTLPAKIRGQFQNDPAQFIDFALDEKNLDELRRMGLANPLVEPPPKTATLDDVVEAIKGNKPNG